MCDLGGEGPTGKSLVNCVTHSAHGPEDVMLLVPAVPRTLESLLGNFLASPSGAQGTVWYQKSNLSRWLLGVSPKHCLPCIRR